MSTKINWPSAQLPPSETDWLADKFGVTSVDSFLHGTPSHGEEFYLTEHNGPADRYVWIHSVYSGRYFTVSFRKSNRERGSRENYDTFGEAKEAFNRYYDKFNREQNAVEDAT
jgi:hypothetical protein